RDLRALPSALGGGLATPSPRAEGTAPGAAPSPSHPSGPARSLTRSASRPAPGSVVAGARPGRRPRSQGQGGAPPRWGPRPPRAGGWSAVAFDRGAPLWG